MKAEEISILKFSKFLEHELGFYFFGHLRPSFWRKLWLFVFNWRFRFWLSLKWIKNSEIFCFKKALISSFKSLFSKFCQNSKNILSENKSVYCYVSRFDFYFRKILGRSFSKIKQYPLEINIFWLMQKVKWKINFNFWWDFYLMIRNYELRREGLYKFNWEFQIQIWTSSFNFNKSEHIFHNNLSKNSCINFSSELKNHEIRKAGCKIENIRMNFLVFKSSFFRWDFKFSKEKF